MTVATAAGKAILLGEHAVVYGRPAIAVPVSDLRATATVTETGAAPGVRIVAEDLGLAWQLGDGDQGAGADEAGALAATVRNTLRHLGLEPEPQALVVAVRSRIPIASGLGSGTAVATAIVRALAAHVRRDLATNEVSELVFQTERILHGTPSGVDNTVVAYERPVYFVRDRGIEFPRLGQALSLVIGDTGVPSKTRDAVASVRAAWRARRARYEALFDAIGRAVDEGRRALATGDAGRVGAAMVRNHQLLGRLGVSSPELDALVEAALAAGARGAKLSGGGLGGCMIALVEADACPSLREALLGAGARAVYATRVV